MPSDTSWDTLGPKLQAKIVVAVQCAVMQMENNSPGFTCVFVGLEDGDLGHVAVTCSSNRKANKMLRFRKAMKNRTQSLQKSLVSPHLEDCSSGPCSSKKVF